MARVNCTRRQYDKRNLLNAHEMMQLFRGKKKKSARINFLQVTRVARSEPFLDLVCHLVLLRAFYAWSNRENPRGSDRAIAKRTSSNNSIETKRATWSKSTQCSVIGLKTRDTYSTNQK